MAKARKIEGLDGDAPVDAAARAILRVRWEEVREYCGKAAEDPTVDAIHDARVATRRLRSAYRDFRPFIRARTLRQVMKDVRTLADHLGAVRDEDVAGATLDQLAEDLGPGMRRDGVLLLGAERRPVRNAAAEELLAYLESAECQGLNERLPEGLDEIESRKRGGGDGTSFKSSGRRIIGKSYKRLVNRSRALFHPHRQQPLHDLRIAAKRLRYALEIFAVCWGDELKTIARSVAELQDALGDLHDCDVWVAGLGKRLKKFNEQPTAETTEIERSLNVAAIWLLGRFTRDRSKHFRDALDLWHRWDSDDIGGRLRRLLDGDGN
jgi:CHAD domain-containing protein